MGRIISRHSITAVIGIGVLVIASVALMLLVSRPGRTQSEKPSSRVAQVTTQVLTPQPWQESFRTYGVVKPVEEIDLAIDFAATVETVHFEEGQRVEAGTKLIEFDPRKRQLKLEQANAVVDDARVRLNEARNDLQRAVKLRQGGVVTTDEHQQCEANYRSTEARLAEALAAQALAQRELDENTLLSPVSGLVASRSVEPGETVMPGEALAKVQVVETVRVVTYVSERDINSLRVGATAAVAAAAAPGELYGARIESLGATADSKTGNFSVKLTVSNEHGLLRDGMTARVTLQGITVDDALIVPRTALADRNRRRVVYVVRDGKAVEIQPALAIDTGEAYLVLAGLSAGDEVILNGDAEIIDGTPVEPVSGSGT